MGWEGNKREWGEETRNPSIHAGDQHNKKNRKRNEFLAWVDGKGKGWLWDHLF